MQNSDFLVDAKSSSQIEGMTNTRYQYQ